MHSGLGCSCFRSCLHCNQEVKYTNELLLDCTSHSTLVTTNVGIPGRRVVRRRQRGIAISFCVVLLKLRCVLLIARIETIWGQTSRNDMETDIPVCANTKYSYLNSDRYYYFPPFPLRTKSCIHATAFPLSSLFEPTLRIDCMNYLYL